MLKRAYTVLPLYYDNSKRVFMTEEYRILEEIEEHQALMKEARMVGEDIMAIVRSIDEVWFPTLGELESSSPHPHLTEYAVHVLEGMGLIAHSDRDDPYWDEYCLDRTIAEGYRAVDRMDPYWMVLVITSKDHGRERTM